jgi:D-alanyl-D-alanine carboxypeptidase
MKNFRVHFAIVFVAFAALLTVMLFDTRAGRGQSQGAGTTRGALTRTVKPTASIREKRVEASGTALTAASARNVSLRTELNWLFGGKPQRGWYLYEPLIGRLLATSDDAASEGFAAALQGWQKRSGLTGTGILDEESLYAMVAHWQGRRLKDRTPAQPDQLVVAPASDFYDPERIDELRQVERQTYAAYKRMVAAAIADKSLGLSAVNGQLAPEEEYLKIISSFRSREYQEKLRRESPHVGSAGLAVNSPHFTGRALDLYVGGEPVETKDSNRAIQIQTPVYQWLVRNAERFGFQPYYYEPWHWEYVGASNHQ